MKKKILSSLLVLVAVFGLTVPEVMAASKWEAYQNTTVVENGDKLTVKTDGSGVINKEYAGTEITEDGVSMSTNVELDLAKLAGSTFTITANVGELEGNPDYPNYVADFQVITTVDENGARVYSSWTASNKESINIDRSGIYTYTWTFKKNADGVVTGEFTVDYYGDEVGKLTSAHEFKNAETGVKPTVLRTLWAYGGYNNEALRPMEKELNLWTELPYVKVTLELVGLTDETISESMDYPLGYAATEEEVAELIAEMEALVEEDGYEFKGFFTDKELTTKFDWTKPMNADTTVYMAVAEAEDTTDPVDPPKPPEKDNPDTSDINLIVLLGTILIGGAGLAFTLKNRKFN